MSDFLIGNSLNALAPPATEASDWYNRNAIARVMSSMKLGFPYGRSVYTVNSTNNAFNYQGTSTATAQNTDFAMKWQLDCGYPGTPQWFAFPFEGDSIGIVYDIDTGSKSSTTAAYYQPFGARIDGRSYRITPSFASIEGNGNINPATYIYRSGNNRTQARWVIHGLGSGMHYARFTVSGDPAWVGDEATGAGSNQRVGIYGVLLPSDSWDSMAKESSTFTVRYSSVSTSMSTISSFSNGTTPLRISRLRAYNKHATTATSIVAQLDGSNTEMGVVALAAGASIDMLAAGAPRSFTSLRAQAGAASSIDLYADYIAGI